MRVGKNKNRSEDQEEERTKKSRQSGKAVMQGKLRRATKKKKDREDEDIDEEEAKENRKKSKAKKKAKEAGLSRNQQGHIIQRLMQRGPVSIQRIAEKTGFTVDRVQNHVDYEISKGRAKLKGSKVIVDADKQPNYRTEVDSDED